MIYKPLELMLQLFHEAYSLSLMRTFSNSGICSDGEAAHLAIA